MSANTYRTITLSGETARFSFRGDGSNAVTPGHVLTLNSTGYVSPIATTSADVMPLIALENREGGVVASTAYGTSDMIKCGVFHTGDTGVLIVSANENIAIGDALESNGATVAGQVRKFVADTSAGTIKGREKIAMALEAATSTSAFQIKVMFY